MAFERVLVPADEAEGGPERSPLVVVQQRPVQVTEHVDAVGHRVMQASECIVGVVDAPRVVRGGDAVLGHEDRRMPADLPCVPHGDA